MNLLEFFRILSYVKLSIIYRFWMNRNRIKSSSQCWVKVLFIPVITGTYVELYFSFKFLWSIQIWHLPITSFHCWQPNYSEALFQMFSISELLHLSEWVEITILKFWKWLNITQNLQKLNLGKVFVSTSTSKIYLLFGE